MFKQPSQTQIQCQIVAKGYQVFQNYLNDVLTKKQAKRRKHITQSIPERHYSVYNLLEIEQGKLSNLLLVSNQLLKHNFQQKNQEQNKSQMLKYLQDLQCSQKVNSKFLNMFLKLARPKNTSVSTTKLMDAFNQKISKQIQEKNAQLFQKLFSKSTGIKLQTRKQMLEEILEKLGYLRYDLQFEFKRRQKQKVWRKTKETIEQQIQQTLVKDFTQTKTCQFSKQQQILKQFKGKIQDLLPSYLHKQDIQQPAHMKMPESQFKLSHQNINQNEQIAKVEFPNEKGNVNNSNLQEQPSKKEDIFNEIKHTLLVKDIRKSIFKSIDGKMLIKQEQQVKSLKENKLRLRTLNLQKGEFSKISQYFKKSHKRSISDPHHQSRFISSCQESLSQDIQYNPIKLLPTKFVSDQLVNRKLIVPKNQSNFVKSLQAFTQKNQMDIQKKENKKAKGFQMIEKRKQAGKQRQRPFQQKDDSKYQGGEQRRMLLNNKAKHQQEKYIYQQNYQNGTIITQANCNNLVFHSIMPSYSNSSIDQLQKQQAYSNFQRSLYQPIYKADKQKQNIYQKRIINEASLEYYSEAQNANLSSSPSQNEFNQEKFQQTTKKKSSCIKSSVYFHKVKNQAKLSPAQLSKEYFAPKNYSKNISLQNAFQLKSRKNSSNRRPESKMLDNFNNTYKAKQKISFYPITIGNLTLQNDNIQYLEYVSDKESLKDLMVKFLIDRFKHGVNDVQIVSPNQCSANMSKKIKDMIKLIVSLGGTIVNIKPQKLHKDKNLDRGKYGKSSIISAELQIYKQFFPKMSYHQIIDSLNLRKRCCSQNQDKKCGGYIY